MSAPGRPAKSLHDEKQDADTREDQSYLAGAGLLVDSTDPVDDGPKDQEEGSARQPRHAGEPKPPVLPDVTAEVIARGLASPDPRLIAQATYTQTMRCVYQSALDQLIRLVNAETAARS